MDELAYGAMKLIHAKNLRFSFEVEGQRYQARFTPRELLYVLT